MDKKEVKINSSDSKWIKFKNAEPILAFNREEAKEYLTKGLKRRK
jgi:hypothetical protein